jgi:hypothetical protein
MADEALLIPCQLGGEIGREYARIRWNLGGGYTPSILVGHSQGVGTFLFRFNALPDRINDTRFIVTDDGDSNTVKTYADYLRHFHARRMVDGNPFNITDEASGATMSVVFIDDELNYRTVGKNVFQCEVRLRQYREPT